MPNYRSRNKNRRHKSRNKNNYKRQQQQEQGETPNERNKNDVVPTHDICSNDTSESMRNALVSDKGSSGRNVTTTRANAEAVIDQQMPEEIFTMCAKYSNMIHSKNNASTEPDQAKVVVHQIVQEEERGETVVAVAREDNLLSKQNDEPKTNNTKEKVNLIIHCLKLEVPLKEVEHMSTIDRCRNAEESTRKEVQIEEVCDASLGECNDNSPIVCEVESEHNVSESNASAYAQPVQTLPINYLQVSLENEKPVAAMQEDDSKQRRLQKRVALETHFLPQLLSPRYLDSIIEESGDASDARSDSSENIRSLISDESPEGGAVFESDSKTSKSNIAFPKSQLDFSKKHKHGPLPKVAAISGVIKEESPQPMVVETQLIEHQPVEETCSILSSIQTPQLEAAEVVYIKSASSSSSDLIELDASELPINSRPCTDLDNDANATIVKIFDNMSEQQTSSRESTPVNQSSSINSCEQSSFDASGKGTNEILMIEEPCDSQILLLTITNKLSHFSENKTLFSGKENNRKEQETSVDAEQCADMQSALFHRSNIENLPSSDSNSLRAEQNALLKNTEMNNVREIINANNSNKDNLTFNLKRSESDVGTERWNVTQNPLPPAIPPPPQLRHLNSEQLRQAELNNVGSSLYDSFKCHQQDIPSINFSSTTSASSSLRRQESTDSHCSDSTNYSQCTAIHLGASPLTDIDVPDNANWTNAGVSKVSDVNIITKVSVDDQRVLYDYINIKKLRQLCAERLLSMPYGETILEELASVARNIGEAHAGNFILNKNKIACPLPNLPFRSDLEISLTPNAKKPVVAARKIATTQTPIANNLNLPLPLPPPVPEPLIKYGSYLALQTEADPKLLVCHSPSQCKYMKESRIIFDNKPDNKTAEIMKKLRKSLTPPPIPPPPIPSKSVETAAKVQTQSKIKANANDANAKNANEEQQNGEENKHNLLTIIHGDNTITTSSYENNSRQSTNNQQGALFNTEFDHNGGSLTFSHLPSAANKILQHEHEFTKLFPSINKTNESHVNMNRHSNIEQSSNTSYGSKSLNLQPKRYSNIETSSFESGKRINNGQVVYDFTNSNHDSCTEGSISSSTPWEAFTKIRPNEMKCTSSGNNNINGETNETNCLANIDDIMSALNINSNGKTTTAPATTSIATAPRQQENTSHTENSEQIKERRETVINRQQSQNSTTNKDINSAYEEFRQHAKTSADVTLSTAPATFDGGNLKSPYNFDTEKLFKDIDDLSQELHNELASSKSEKMKRDQLSSVYDLSRMQVQNKTQFEEFKKYRQEHMQELEREIDRSLKSRQMRNNSSKQEIKLRPAVSRTYQIPIELDSCDSTNRIETKKEVERSYEIPIHVDMHPNHTSYYEDDSRFRRAESMFNISDNIRVPRHRTNSVRNDGLLNPDERRRLENDFVSSENVTKPFAREVEMCAQRLRTKSIRAPRLSASTNNLFSNMNNFDNFNAYNVRRTHAPMLSRKPQKIQPQYLGCHSMLERDPNPTYISTTSRRGVSPAPRISTQLESPNTHGQQLHQRRASLPREIHQHQQLKYISCKEVELKNEFDRLQNERRKLVDEMNRAQMIQSLQRPMREPFRSALHLPTLSEDEVFRQQMAEEWLNKVAEREERRLHKIIKLSKLNEQDGHTVPVTLDAAPNFNISEEFLNRVKERRSKLSMPSDSDWESGAESQPIGKDVLSESEELPPVKVIDGKTEADLSKLPKHLREFATFSNSQTEQINGGHREIHQEEKRRKEANNNSLSSAMKKSSIVTTVKIARVPPALDYTEMQNRTPYNALSFQGECTETESSTSTASASSYSTRTTFAIFVGAGSLMGAAVVVGISLWKAWKKLI